MVCEKAKWNPKNKKKKEIDDKDITTTPTTIRNKNWISIENKRIQQQKQKHLNLLNQAK